MTQNLHRRDPIEFSHVQVDFSQVKWRITNDGVMGGCSGSQLDIDPDGLHFHGELSTANRGGFVSVLGRLPAALKQPVGFSLLVCGDERRYQLRLRESESARDVAWRAFFNSAEQKSRILVAMDEFHPVMRGQPAIAAKSLARTPIHYLGFMLTSRQAGLFDLRIHALEMLYPKEHVKTEIQGPGQSP